MSDNTRTDETETHVETENEDEDEDGDETETDTADDTATEITESVRDETDEHGETSGERTATIADVETLREDIVAFAEEVDDRTVDRDALEDDLEAYVRKRQRRGHARGWGPYLVLLYGTAMTIGAFFFLNGGWAILAMLVVWLSTLGLYALMALVGFAGSAVGAPGRLMDRINDFRS